MDKGQTNDGGRLHSIRSKHLESAFLELKDESNESTSVTPSPLALLIALKTPKHFVCARIVAEGSSFG